MNPAPEGFVCLIERERGHESNRYNLQTFANDGYSRDDRAYHLRRLSTQNSDIQFSLEAGEKSPAVNPAFVIDGWGSGGASLALNGKSVTEGKNFRVGHIERLEGTALIVWIRAQLTQPTKFRLTSKLKPQ